MRWRMKQGAVAVALVTGLMSTTVAWGQVIPPGQDCLETAAGSTRVYFGGASQIPPLPNDFFFDGSQAWEGTIELVGDPLPDYVGSVNIVVERKEEAVMPGPATVAIELVELQLRSVDPIVVLDSQDPPGEHYYDVEVTLADTPSTGFMTIEATSPVGGEYRFDDASGGGIYVYATFNFFEAWPSRQEPIVWDAPPLLLQSDGPLPWQYEQPLLFCYPDQQFYPVPEYVATTLLDGGESGEHGVIPPREPEACCLQDGDCIDVDPDECANFYMGWAQGPGTACEGYTLACCLQDGTGACVDAEPQCCDDLNGLPSPSGEPACLGDLTGNGVDDACEAECVPTADGLWCEDVLCPYPDETCWPRSIRVDYAAQTVEVTECACLGDNDCRVVYVIQTDPWDVTVYCQGGCPAGEQCELIESYAGGDSFDYECRCESECRPTPDGMSCEDVPCPDASQVCLPKVVRRNVPPVFFPPGGIDVLTPTSGIIAIEDPGGLVESYSIMPGDPNITRVVRGDPIDAGGYRVVDTEIIEMELMGGGGAGGTILVHQSASQPSVGQMIGTTSDTTDFPAESFFDVYVTVDIPDMPGAESLYHTQPIPLSASGLMDVPPWDAPFVTPDGWPGVELLTAGGDPTGYTIVYVSHELPPPPPEYQIVECECMDPDYCHIEYDPAAEPTCTGGCPWPEICVMTVQDTDGDGIDDRWECVCEPECKPRPDGLACEIVPCPTDPEECEPKAVGLYVPPIFFPPGGIDDLTPTTGVIAIEDPSGFTENYTIMAGDPNITRVLRGEPMDAGGYRVIATEVIEMELVGGGGGGGSILVHQSMDQPSVGQIVGSSDGTSDFPAESFFDVYVTVDIPDVPGAVGLYNGEPIPLSASGITDVPPWGAPFETAADWTGVALLDNFGDPTGYKIVYVNHELPPPPAYQIIECECMDPGYCHVDYDPYVEPTCIGDCPWPETCVMTVQDTDGDGIDDRWECVCEPECKPIPDGTACEVVPCPLPTEECQPKVVARDVPLVFFPPGGIDVLAPTSGVITVEDPSGATENYEIMPVDPNITRVLRGDPIDAGGYRVIDTEIIEMELVGGALGGMTILVHQSADQPSVGQMIGTTSDTTDFPAESFFDVYVTVDIPSAPGAEGLYHTAPIPLSASGLTDVPPWGAPFETPSGWNGVDLLDSFGEPTGYRIVYVIHELPPPPPEFQIVECECMDPDYCHIAYDPAAEPTCTGNCPWPEVCVMHAQDTDGDGVDDLWECVCEPGLHPKWAQLPDDPEHNFEAKSDLWWHEELVTIKFEQPFNPEYPGLPSYDWFEGQIILAEDWLCEGGTVKDFHWWGGVFHPGSGIYGFRISLHDAVLPECLPAEPPIWAIDVPIGQITVTPTGIFNGDNLEIIRYDYDLPPEFWFEQETGSQYFVNISAISLDSWDPYVWRWQESARTMTPQHCPAAEYRLPVPGAWQHLTTDDLYFVDLAFAVTSQDTTPEVNKVVADDFTSDGRPIQALRWWGSYWDDMYAPGVPPVEPYVIDGWLLSFHHAEPEADCPPGSSTADVPTVLGVYFAPADQVEILPLDMGDCLGHGVYEYIVDLNNCCLICSEVDPRTGNTPALPYTFYEEAGFKYWLDIQAIVGAEWVPSSPVPEECELVLTGHLPSPNTPDGHFWGWHTSLGIASPYPLLDEACTGQIVGFAPYPPNCWDYGNWVTQPYLCPDPPVPFPVHMAFELLTPDPVPVPLGACCLQDQSCVMLPGDDACHEQGGVYLGDYIPCEDQCSTGACCDEDGCHETTREECMMGSICHAYWGADPPPQCMGDCNGDNRVNPQDVGLVKYYYGDTSMAALCRFDVNCDGTIAPQDVGLVKYHYTDPCGSIPPSYLDPTCTAYYGVPGEWYGYGTYCEDGSGGGVTCACICPAGAAHESSAWCGYEDPDPNGGCYEDPWVFDPIACGETVCGMVSIEPDPNVPGDRLIDTDWYAFTLTTDAFVAWSVHSDFPAMISIYQSDCTLLTQNAGGGGDCGEVPLGMSLTPGTYYAVVEPDEDALLWLPCTGQNNRYYATLQCDSR